MQKIFLIGALPSSLVNFRGELVKSLVMIGHNVTGLACGAGSLEIKKVNELGANYIDYPVSRNGLSPKEDLRTFMSFREIFKTYSPDIILAYTIKPVIWAALASSAIPNCRFFALITGLGFAFQRGNWKKNLLVKLVIFLYKVALKRAERVIFQNPDNRQVFIDLGIVPAEKTAVVNGSGVDVSYFDTKPLPDSPRFLLIARLLGDKGIREYIQAVKLVKQTYKNVVFQLVGPVDPSPNGISIEELERLNDTSSVEYLGASDDVRPFIENCSVFVLPSYHEGLPRTVLEAMATGRPILTTDVPGCRETVIDGENGWLVEKGNAEQLAEKMIWFIENQREWQRMANASRAMAVNKFDVQAVNAELLKIMRL